MLKKKFYKQQTLTVAKELLGCFLVTQIDGKRCVGKIVETEAYLSNDPACHAAKKKTSRNSMMFEEGGVAYVYFTYGMYHCFNTVTQKKDCGEAVLIRALEPLEGIDVMQKRRGRDKVKDLCSGPAKLVIAMGLDKTHNGHSLTSKDLHILQRKEKEEFVTTTRIGISEGAELPYRFYIKDSQFISRK